MSTAIKSKKRLRKLYFAAAAIFFCGPLGAQEKRAVASPNWIRDAAVYEVSLRGFSTDTKFFTLEDRLMKLKNWGADVLCLAPVTAIGEESIPGHLGDLRAVKDFAAFDYEFGTKDAFKSLMQQCHYVGLKVVLTWVADTTSRDHSWIKNKPEWYVKNSSGEIAGAADHPDLALLDLNNSSLQDELIKIMIKWVDEYGIDGLKCQSLGAANLEFWAKARKALTSAKKDFVLIAGDDTPDGHVEAFDLSPSVRSHQFLKKMISGEEKTDGLERFIKDEEQAYPDGSLRARYLESLYSDRAKKSFGPAQRAAAAFNGSMPGVFWILAGEEGGEARTLPVNGKVSIDWKSADKDLVKFYKSVLKLRHAHPAMSRGQVFQVPAPADKKILAYARTYRGDAVLAVINFSDQEWKGSLEVPEVFKSDKGALKLKPALTDIDFSGSVLTLPPYGCQIFTAK